MRAENKIRILTWAIVAIALLSVSTIATIIYHIRNGSSTEEYVSNEANSLQMSGREFRDALNLSPQQMDEFRSINLLFRQSAREINILLDKTRDIMFTELKNENPDMEVCKQLSAEIGRLHKELKLITCEFYMDVRDLCDPGQEKKLEEIFAPVFGSLHGFGYGGGQGRRFMNRRRGNN